MHKIFYFSFIIDFKLVILDLKKKKENTIALALLIFKEKPFETDDN